LRVIARLAGHLLLLLLLLSTHALRVIANLKTPKPLAVKHACSYAASKKKMQSLVSERTQTS
jgi:hypothetical protein